MKTLSLLIKPVSYQCNLNCTYCFYKRVNQLYPHNTTIMSQEVLSRLIISAINTGANFISFCWQGGEPTLAGLDFFRAIVTLQNNYRKQHQVIENSIQTNGVLIDEQWCRFLQQNNFLVGISLDGPEEMHNNYRHNNAGSGTFETVMRSIRLMNEHRVNYNILTLLNDINIDHPEEVYRFFRENNFAYLQFIPCFEHDDNGAVLPYSVTGLQLGTFYCELFDEWYQDGFPYVQIRLFQDILMYMVERIKPSCTWLEYCNSYVVVEHNGDCYPCDFFVYPQWKLGNIMSHSIQDILGSPIRNAFSMVKQNTVDECNGCSIKDFCMGDCPRYRVNSTMNAMNALNKSEYCTAWKVVYEHFQRYEGELQQRIRRLQKSIQSGSFFHTQRNDSCPCGSEKKFKKCCGRAPLAL